MIKSANAVRSVVCLAKYKTLISCRKGHVSISCLSEKVVSLIIRSRNNLSIRLGMNKLKTCQPALTNSFANRTVSTSKWPCIWLSVLKLPELLLENVSCLSRFALNKAKVAGLRH